MCSNERNCGIIVNCYNIKSCSFNKGIYFMRCIKCKKPYKKGERIILLVSHQYIPQEFFSREFFNKKTLDVFIDGSGVPYSIHQKCFDGIIENRFKS